MERITKRLMMSLLVATSIFIPVVSQALTDQEIMQRTHIVNLEAMPLWFRPGQPIDFVATIKYDGGTQDGLDVVSSMKAVLWGGR